MESPDVTHWTFQGIPCRQRVYCLNGGTCTYFPRLQIQACNCSVGFEGSRCEFVTNLISSSESRATACSYDSYLTNDTGYRMFVIFSNIIIIILLCLLLAFICRLRRGKMERPSSKGGVRSAKETMCDKSLPHDESGLNFHADRPKKSSYLGRMMSVLGLRPEDPRENYHVLSPTARTSLDSGNGMSTYEASVETKQAISKWAVVRRKLLDGEDVDTENETAD